ITKTEAQKRASLNLSATPWGGPPSCPTRTLKLAAAGLGSPFTAQPCSLPATGPDLGLPGPALPGPAPSTQAPPSHPPSKFIIPHSCSSNTTWVTAGHSEPVATNRTGRLTASLLQYADHDRRQLQFALSAGMKGVDCRPYAAN